jgi:two-component system, NarL family, sensor kinase
MSSAYIRTKWWIIFFCSFISLLEITAPIEYVFGYLYVVPILLAACELDIYYPSIFQRGNRTSQVTKWVIFLTLFDFIVSGIYHLSWPNVLLLPTATIVNKVNVVFVLLLTDWLIHRNLKYLAEIYQKKEDLVRSQTNLLAQIRLDRMHEDFVYTLTHDLKTPLLGGIQAIDFFQKEKFGPVTPTQSKVFDTMARSQHLSLQLVETLLDIYHNESEGLIIQNQFIDLKSIAIEAIEIVENLGLNRQITFEFKFNILPDLSRKLRGDRLQLSRVFSNLLTNAIYHSHRGGCIDVAIHYQDARYIVEILDRGDGINLADLPFLFDRFYKARDRLKGSGLGLHLSRQIVEAHGGRIWVENVSQQGAKFCFNLPSEK